MKQVIFEITNEYLDGLSDKAYAIRRYVEKEVEKHIRTGSLYKMDVNKLFKVYEACRDYYLPHHATLMCVFGTTMFGQEFLDKFGVKDSVCWNYRLTKYNRIREKVANKHLVKPGMDEKKK